MSTYTPSASGHLAGFHTTLTGAFDYDKPLVGFDLDGEPIWMQMENQAEHEAAMQDDAEQRLAGAWEAFQKGTE